MCADVQSMEKNDMGLAETVATCCLGSLCHQIGPSAAVSLLVRKSVPKIKFRNEVDLVQTVHLMAEEQLTGIQELGKYICRPKNQLCGM